MRYNKDTKGGEDVKNDTLTIVNNSGHVINISNNYFSKDIPIDASVTFTKQDFNNDHHCKVKYFSLKDKTENELEETRDIGNRWMLIFSSKTYLPMATELELDIENCTEIILHKNTVTFRFLTMIFKTVYLERVTADDQKSTHKFSFVENSSRKKFLRYLLIELFIALPILLALIGTSIYTFIDPMGLYESIFLYVLSLICAKSVVRKLLYFTRYK